jgi:ABC-type multidrug transport system fused ATPase/permease subunit
LSVGQRQLVGLARVLLSDAPVVVMDEPTSSIDPITDELIQRMLREKLKGRTVLTIAHRLGTLRTSDLIIELEAGHLKRIGPPQEILPQIVDEIEALTAD